MKNILYTFLFLLSLIHVAKSQSDNCATATPISLSSGTACINGTTIGGTNDGITTGCNASSVNFVWYQFVSTGTNNTITITPTTLQNPVMIVDGTNCTDGAIDFCNNATGSNPITILDAQPVGTTILISIATTSGNQGTFQVCVRSLTPTNPSLGDDCAIAIPYCNTSTSPNFSSMAGFTGSGTKPSCFIGPGSTPSQDMWITFTCTQNGTIAWTGNPGTATAEYDWAMYNTTAGCNGTQVACNYNWGSQTGLNFGMGGSGTGEFSPAFNGVAGQTYTIRISNWAGDGTGFVFSWQGTALIAPVVNFNVAPSAITCSTSVTANITNTSAGIPTWSFGNGNTYTGTTPPSQTYTTTGTYAITATIAGACPATLTKYVQLFGPLAATVAPTPATCPGVCNGVAQVTGVTGGNGVYTYAWSPGGATTNQITGLCVGIYSVTISNAICGTSITKTVSITAPPAASLTVNSNAPFCIGGTLNLTASGASTYTWSGSGLATTTGSAVSTTTPSTGTYSVSGTSTLGCVSTGTIAVVINPKPSATLSFTNPTCGLSNGIIVINNTSPALPAQTISTYTSNLGTVSGQTVTGLAASSPIITLTNNFGCTFTVSTTLTNTPGPSALVLTPVNTTCGQSNGSITIGAVTGGTPTYSFALNGSPSFTTTSPVSGLTTGTYSITVKDSKGCLFTTTTSIANIPGPTAIAGTTTQASCNTNNGTHLVTGVTGGTAAYTYSVDGVSTPSLTSGLAAGTHTVLVRDANGCVFTRTFVIGTANGPSSFTVNTTNSNCGLANGTSTVSGVVGGTPTYSFSFDGGAFATTTTASGLLAGTHTVIVKDVNSCTISATYSVSNNPPPTASVTSSLNVLCNGASTGSLTVAPVGGTAPFTYTLTTPTQTNTTGAFTGLPVGTYSITLKDNFGCTATVTAVISQPTPVTGSVSSIPVNCFGNSTGTVSAGGSGGVGPYTYLWPALGSSTFATVGGAAAGTYTVNITDANLCSITRTVTVTQPTSLTLTSTLTPATCGNANGSGTVTVSGGTTTYNYNWSNGGLTNVLTAASAGTYTLTVQDFNGCVLTRTVAITNIPGPTAITGTTTLAGCGLSNGTYNVTGVTGGTAAYSYSVDAIATTSLTSGLAAGTHTILVRDFNGCLFSTTFNINTASGPTSATVATTNASCGTANGTSTVTGVTGGLAAYQYSFDGGVFGAANTTTGLAAGSHTVVIRDANSCTLTVVYTEFNNSGPTASVTNSINVLCNGNSTGSFTVTPSGGIAPFTYTLTAPVQTNTTGVFTGLPAGAYNVTVKDNSGCTATTSVTLTQPTAVTLTVTSLPVNCFGTSTGTVSASGSGGTGSHTYLWPALGSSTLATINNVAAGTYTVTQTDANLCSISQSITVTQPTSLTLTSTLTPATCGNANGSGTVTVSGGTPAYTYSWSNSGITSTLSGVLAGTYILNVTDFNNCILTRTLTVTNIPGPTAITGTTTLAGCGLSNGTYNVTGVTGGTPAYSFSVDAIATTSLTSGLAAGTHTVTVTDFNACLFSTTFNIGTTTGPVTATITSGNASCGSANGTSTVTGVTGGLAPYQYSFDGGLFVAGTTTTGLTAGTHTVTIKDANSCTLTVTYNVLNNGSPTASIISSTNTSCFGGTNGGFTIAGSGGSGTPYTYTLSIPFQSNGTGVFTGLSAGTFSVITKDNAGCTTTTTITVLEPTPVALTATALPAMCFGAATGTINLTGSGGTPTYSYNLNGGTYQVSSTFANQFAAIYTMGIKDVNGCLSTQTVQVTQPTALAIQVASQNANCTAANGIGTTTVTGGTPIYTYTWTGGGGAAATSNGIVSGNYTVTATDANGCVISSPVVIGLTPGGTASITALTNVTCNGANNGSMTAGMIGGAGPFTYSWTPGGQTVASAINLSPATYTCDITDFYGCKASIAGTITQPPILTAIMNSNNVKCFGTSTGTISAAGSGGTGPYTYLWSTIPSTLSTVNNVAIGNYPCSITDFNGCTITQSIAVTQPTTITLTPTVTSANCNQANGSGTITASGGAPGAYTYTWSSGSNTTIQGSVLAGTYTITVQDANNCLQTLAVTIPNTAGPVISISSQTNVSCFGGTNGAAITSVSGGVGTYTYSWSNGNTSSIATNLASNIYTVSATDGAGCVASTSVSITEPTPLMVGILPTNPKCFGSTNGFGIAAASGGTPSYIYAWTSTGGGSATSNQLGAGNYGLTVTDGNGCVVTSSMALINPAAMAASITSTNVSCFGTCNGTAIATSTNGIGVVSYFWIGGPSPIAAQTASGLCAGSYTVVATDQNSCTASAQVNITQPTQVTANITSTGSVTCNGGSNGFAVVTPAGGTGAYTYTWSPIGGNTATASSLVAGICGVTVQDANLCTAMATATIIEPAPLATTLTTTDVKCYSACDGTGNIGFSGGAGTTTFLWLPGLQSGNFVNNLCVGNQTVNITSNGTCTSSITFTLTEPAVLTAVASATNSNCGQNNGKACVIVGGGTLPYNNLWNNGITTLCNNNIVAAAYSFTVTDGNGCKAFASGLVNDIAGPVVSVLSQSNISCFNGSNGAATTTITGGVPSYSVSWTDGQTTQNVNNFTAGIKNITIVDAAGCIGTASVNITQPTQLVSAIGSFTNVTCNGLSNGGATMLVNGGTIPYTYTWSPSAQTSSVMIGIPANTYTGNVSDANGCSTSQQVVISEPQSLLMTASGFTNVSCFGGNNGQISTTFQGGTFPYTYSWTPSGSGGILNGLVAGGYNLSLVDANNCPQSANFTITQPSVLTSTFTSLPATCGLINGSATVTIGGGTPTYSVVWNLPGTPTGTTAINMPPGCNWIANITDLNGCTLTQTVCIANPPIPAFTPNSTTSPSCFGLSNGDITLNYTPGTAPYTVVWSSPISQTITTSALTQSVAGVAAGAYTAILTDFYGCTTSQPVNVTQPGLLVLLVNSNPSICFGQTTQLTASGQNGTPGYSYTWSPNPFVGGGPHTVSPTTTTTYTVAVSDANSCSPSPKIITVNVTPQLNAIGTSVTLCHGGSTVLTPTITSPGNSGAYTYTWSPIVGNANSMTVIGSAPTVATTNTFAVTISDGCTIPDASAIFTVNVNPLPVISFTANPLQGCAPLTVTLTGTSIGGSSSDIFTWTENRNGSLGQGNPSIFPVFADSGKYSITLNVVNPVTGCSSTLTKANYVEVFPKPIASFYADPVKASILDPNINFINTSQGAISYYWNFGDPAALNGTNNSTVFNPSHGYTYIGEYAVNLVVTSSKGCKDTARLNVEITPDFALYIPNSFTPDGNGLNDIFQPMGVGIDEDSYRMDIFDRWGENIFTSNNFRKGWDGTVKGGSITAEQGVYTYKIMVKDIMGNKHPMVGHVTIIRQNN